MTRPIFTARFNSGLAYAGMAALFSCVIASCALADEDQVPQAQIKIAGTDFRSPASVEALRNRVRRVAREMCATDAVSGGFAMSRSQRACYDKAISTGFAEIARRQQLALGYGAGETASASPMPGRH